MTRALRVLHIASGDLWAGAEVQAFTLLCHLSRIPEIEVAAVLMNERTLADKLRSVGIRVYVIDERKEGVIRILATLYRVLSEWRPDVIHTHREKENILGSLANRVFRNVPCVRTVHGAEEHGAMPGSRYIRHNLIKYADRLCGRFLQQRIIAVTQELAGRLANEFPSWKIVAIENGIDVQAVTSQKSTAEFKVADRCATHVGIAGRLVEVKRVDLFIEAASLLLREHPERTWRFHVFGEGPMRSNLEELSERLQLGGRLTFHGHRDDMATCVGGLDVLVICSDHEGMPMISLEAAALEVPTVAHAVGGLIEVVAEEFLVDRHDARGYMDGILRALAADRLEVTVLYAARAVSRFSARQNAERVHALYEAVVSERNLSR